MKIDINNLSVDELIDLNHRIIERLKFLESMSAHNEMMRFAIGQRVTFQPSGRSLQTGTLIRYNRKTVSVVTESGQRWNVAPHLLSPADDAGTRTGKSGNVIDMKSKRKKR